MSPNKGRMQELCSLIFVQREEAAIYKITEVAEMAMVEKRRSMVVSVARLQCGDKLLVQIVQK